MKKDIQVTICTDDDVRVSVDEWDNGSVWLHLQGRGASMNCTLTRPEAEQMLGALQAILAKEVTA